MPRHQSIEETPYVGRLATYRAHSIIWFHRQLQAISSRDRMRAFLPLVVEDVCYSPEMCDQNLQCESRRRLGLSIIAILLTIISVSPCNQAQEFTVRTANIGPLDTTAERDLAVLQALGSPSGESFGVTGLQEDDFPGCGGRSCLELFADCAIGVGKSSVFHRKNLTILAISPLFLASQGSSWEIGRDDWRHRTALFFGGQRYMMEMVVYYGGQSLRFYTLHLSHENQSEQRKTQIRNVIKIIKSRAGRFEGLPIVVGDFNFKPEKEPETFRLMNEAFEAVESSGIDQIWIGRGEVFPNHSVAYQVVRKGSVNLGAGFDHASSPWAVLKMVMHEPPGTSGCLGRQQCCIPGNEHCDLCLDECRASDSGCGTKERCCEKGDLRCAVCSKNMICP